MSKAKTTVPPPSRIRDKNGRFVKGNCGGGRKQLREEFKQFAQEKSVEALQVVYAIMTDVSTSQRDRTAAARLLMEYGYGRPAAEFDRERLDIEIKRLQMDEKKQEADSNENAKIEVIISNQAKEWGE